MQKSYFIPSRNENLYREFLNRLGKNGRSIREIFDDLAANAPADRFYISEEQAQRIVSRLNRGKTFTRNSRSPRVRMARDIQRRVNNLRKANPRMSLREAVYQVVNSPAPAFYLTAGSIRTILYTLHRAKRS